MSEFETSTEDGSVQEQRGEEVAPFVTKIGAVTVTHSKPSAETPSNFEFLCQPCEAPSAPKEDASDSDDEDNKEDTKVVAPVDRRITPKDVTQINDDDDTIYIVGTQGSKVTLLHNLENMTQLKELTCRSCLIGSMDGLVENHSTLRKLELYDNHVQKLTNLEFLKNLIVLDMSYNAIRDMSPVASCVNLEELYLAQNKLRQVQGVDNLTKLRILDLGANRIRVVDAVTSLTSLKSLWLGKNKIEEVPDLSPLQSLRQLDLQSNRLNFLGTGLESLSNLEELYLACNNLQSLGGLPRCTVAGTTGTTGTTTTSDAAGGGDGDGDGGGGGGGGGGGDSQVPSSEQSSSSLSSSLSSAPLLNTLDITSNKINNVEPVAHLKHLEEFWLSSNLIACTEALLPLQSLPALSCIYLEHSPIQTSLKAEYRAGVLAVLPQLSQLDASLVKGGR